MQTFKDFNDIFEPIKNYGLFPELLIDLFISFLKIHKDPVYLFELLTKKAKLGAFEHHAIITKLFF